MKPTQTSLKTTKTRGEIPKTTSRRSTLTTATTLANIVQSALLIIVVFCLLVTSIWFYTLISVQRTKSTTPIATPTALKRGLESPSTSRQTTTPKKNSSTNQTILLSSTTTTTTTERVETRVINEAEPPLNFTFPHKLSGDVVPRHYDLLLKLVFDNKKASLNDKNVNSHFVGKVISHFTCRIQTRVIVMHSVQLSYRRRNPATLLSILENRHIRVHELEIIENEEIIKVHLGEMLKSGFSYTLGIEFGGRIGTTPKGLFESIVPNHDGSGTSIVATYLQPTFARRVFPCFDELSIRTTFDLVVVRPSHFVAISNMPKSKEEDRSNGYVADYFYRTPLISPHLVGLVVGPFSSVHRQHSNISLGIYNIHIDDNAIYALDVAAKAISFYEILFDIHYPFPKLDLAAVPNLPVAGYSSWGLLTFQKQIIFLSENEQQLSDKLYVLRLVSHHIAHQWMGNLISIYWWDSLWFNEGFANYFSYYAVSSFDDTTRNVGDIILVKESQSAMELDALPGAQALAKQHTTTNDIEHHITPLLYFKSTSIFQMMVHMIESAEFEKALKRFFKSYAYRSVIADHFYHSMNLAQTTGIRPFVNITEVIETWTTAVGVPLVTVIRNDKDRVLEVRQSRFYFANTVRATENLWTIPISYTSATEGDFNETAPRYWLSGQSEKWENLLQPDEWLIINIKAIGYYKVQYDLKNWMLLAQQLVSDHEAIHALNRAQLVDDSLDLARAGMLSYHVAFKLLSYIQHETATIPWMAALDNFEKIDLTIKRPIVLQRWHTFATLLMSQQYALLAANNLSRNDVFKSELQTKLLSLSCKYNHKPCLHTASKLLTDLKQDIKRYSNQPKSLRFIYLCQAIKQGNNSDFENIFHNYQTLSAKSEQAEIIQALTCTTNIILLQELLIALVNGDSGKNITVPYINEKSSKLLSVNKIVWWRYNRQVMDSVLEQHLRRLVVDKKPTRVGYAIKQTLLKYAHSESRWRQKITEINLMSELRSPDDDLITEALQRIKTNAV